MNEIFAIFLLQGAVDTVSRPIMTENTRYWMIIGGAALAVVLFLGIWVLVVLRSNRNRVLHQRRRRDEETRVGTDRTESRRRRHRHRRRPGETDDHLPRNPTLAETGGLPPLRERPGQRP